VPALPSSVLEPLWVQVAALLPTRRTPIRWAATAPASPTGSCSTSSSRSWCSAAATGASPTTCSATTLRRGRDEWISAGVAEQVRLAVLAAYDRLFGLELKQLAVDGCITKAPCGGQVAGPSPTDRREQGLNLGARWPPKRAGSRWRAGCPGQPAR
jgi:hypothetical protein